MVAQVTSRAVSISYLLTIAVFPVEPCYGWGDNVSSVHNITSNAAAIDLAGFPGWNVPDEYFVWRQYGSNSLVYIPIAKRDYEQWKDRYPCQYYPGYWMDHYYGCKAATPGHSTSCASGSYWVTNHVPQPAGTYCGDTYYYAYCKKTDFSQDVTGTWKNVDFITKDSKKKITTYLGVKQTYTESTTVSASASAKYKYKGLTAKASVEYSHTWSNTYENNKWTEETEEYKYNTHGYNTLWQYSETISYREFGNSADKWHDPERVNFPGIIRTRVNQRPRCYPSFCEDESCQTCQQGYYIPSVEQLATEPVHDDAPSTLSHMGPILIVGLGGGCAIGLSWFLAASHWQLRILNTPLLLNC